MANVQPGGAPVGLRLRSKGQGGDLRGDGRALAERRHGPDLDHGLPRPREEHGRTCLDRPCRLRDHDPRSGLCGQRTRRGHSRGRRGSHGSPLSGHGREQRRVAPAGLARGRDSSPGLERSRPHLDAPRRARHGTRSGYRHRWFGVVSHGPGRGRVRGLRGCEWSVQALRGARTGGNRQRDLRPRRAVESDAALRDDKGRGRSLGADRRTQRLRGRWPHLAHRQRFAATRILGLWPGRRLG